MAGRPRTMLDRVDRFETAAYSIGDAILQTIPEQYQDDFEDGDWIGEMWHESLKTAIHLWLVVADLGNLLRDKAGISGDGPTAELWLMRRQPRPAPGDLDLHLLDDKPGPEEVSGGARGGIPGVPTEANPAPAPAFVDPYTGGTNHA